MLDLHLNDINIQIYDFCDDLAINDPSYGCCFKIRYARNVKW